MEPHEVTAGGRIAVPRRLYALRQTRSSQPVSPLAQPESQSAAPAQPPAPSVCELCSAALHESHPHLLELARRRIVCACDACALLFDSPASVRFRRIPRDVERLDDFALSDLEWEALQIPIGLAFLLRRSEDGQVVAMYPSPAGATASLPAPEAWTALESANPVLSRMQPDVQALLVNRVKQTRACFLAPIDVCYRLVGLIRLHWRGFSGGNRVWREIDGFFEELTRRSRPAKGGTRA